MANRKWAEGARADIWGPLFGELARTCSDDATEHAELCEENIEMSAPEAWAMLSESERDRIFKEFEEMKGRMLALMESPGELLAQPATLTMLQAILHVREQRAEKAQEARAMRLKWKMRRMAREEELCMVQEELCMAQEELEMVREVLCMQKELCMVQEKRRLAEENYGWRAMD
jgi:hypothetical protein